MIIKLIIKAVNGNAISIIVEDGRLPFQALSDSSPDIDETIENIAKIYNIHSAYVQPKLVTLLVEINEICAYYTILTPLEFLNEKSICKLCNNFSKLSEQDRIAIRQSISVFPY